jgi:ATP-binding cassette subfamily B protein
MMFRPVRLLADKFNTLQMGLVASERVFDVLDTKEHIRDEGKISPTDFQGHLEFKDVVFAYDNENNVLKNISFELEAGKTMAIVGSTGSGKSSMINILLRFYEINDGLINVDGTDIRKYKLKDYRSHFALVLQDVFLFTGSIYENISLRNPDISLEEVEETAKVIGADKFIKDLPGGYDFQISERGNNLSAGLRQLISFVRALVIDPKILVLDEATSSIDSETESIIQYAIEKLIEKRTSIIIAHRLSTIQHADKILVLDNGKIVERGTHNSLLQIEDGYFKKLHEMQFAENLV